MKNLKMLRMGSDKVINGENLNHRFRGIAKNNINKNIFIEISLIEISKNSSPSFKEIFEDGDITFHVCHCFDYALDENYPDRTYKQYCRKSTNKKASLKNILDYINFISNSNYESLELIAWMGEDANYDAEIKKMLEA